MIKSFSDRATEELFRRTRVHRQFRQMARQARVKLHLIHAAQTLGDLRVPPGNRLEKLAGDRKGQYSIRINDQFRICFTWRQGDAYGVEIIDYH